ncbi:hypothetical protein BDV09DRAFT_161463 [Aspergillus tetrazonus]
MSAVNCVAWCICLAPGVIAWEPANHTTCRTAGHRGEGGIGRLLFLVLRDAGPELEWNLKIDSDLGNIKCERAETGSS